MSQTAPPRSTPPMWQCCAQQQVKHSVCAAADVDDFGPLGCVVLQGMCQFMFENGGSDQNNPADPVAWQLGQSKHGNPRPKRMGDDVNGVVWGLHADLLYQRGKCVGSVGGLGMRLPDCAAGMPSEPDRKAPLSLQTQLARPRCDPFEVAIRIMRKDMALRITSWVGWIIFETMQHNDNWHLWFQPLQSCRELAVCKRSALRDRKLGHITIRSVVSDCLPCLTNGYVTFLRRLCDSERHIS